MPEHPIPWLYSEMLSESIEYLYYLGKKNRREGIYQDNESSEHKISYLQLYGIWSSLY